MKKIMLSVGAIIFIAGTLVYANTTSSKDCCIKKSACCYQGSPCCDK